MFNGKIDDGQIFHVNYSPGLKVFGEMPISGELTIHAHTLNIIIPKEIPEKELPRLQERIIKRKISSGFLSSKKSIETI